MTSITSCPNCDHVISDGSVGSVTYEFDDGAIKRVEILARFASEKEATQWMLAAKPWERDRP